MGGKVSSYEIKQKLISPYKVSNLGISEDISIL